MTDQIDPIVTSIRSTIQQLDRIAKLLEDQIKQPKSGGRQHIAQSLPTDQLGPAPDIKDKAWPAAVTQQFLSFENEKDSTKQKFKAAQTVRSLNSNHFQMKGGLGLDCGCGLGYLTYELSNLASEIVGYDIVDESPVWDTLKKQNVVFTTDKAVVDHYKAFDFIVLYDVIDHLQNVDMEEFLSWLASLLNPTGRIYMRCHPWTSRSGGHIHDTLNKAYAHLAFTPEELLEFGVSIPPNLKLTRPLSAYTKAIGKAGLDIAAKFKQSEPVDEYFSGDLLDRMINITWRGKIDQDTALKIMNLQYMDFVLKHSD